MKILLILAACLSFYSINSFTKKYEIKTGADGTGTLILTNDSKDNCKGYIEYDFYKGKLRRDRSLVGRLFGARNEKINIRCQLPDTIAKSLISNLYSNGMEDLITCEEDDDCKKKTFLDGGYTSFILTLGGKTRHLTYPSISSDKVNHKETTPLRQKVQDLIVLIQKLIDNDIYRKQAYSQLKPGSYFYYTALGYATFERK